MCTQQVHAHFFAVHGTQQDAGYGTGWHELLYAGCRIHDGTGWPYISVGYRLAQDGPIYRMQDGTGWPYMIQDKSGTGWPYKITEAQDGPSGYRI
jgi:hypothetical protein